MLTGFIWLRMADWWQAVVNRIMNLLVSNRLRIFLSAGLLVSQE
jgi:hypothetical protein